MTAPDSRYRIVDESQSAHCCFGLTIVDTTKPDMVGGKQYVGRNGPQFKSVCECFEEADAKLICDALNLQALARGPQRAGGEDAKDAARYRWIRACDSAGEQLVMTADGRELKMGHDLDAAIDAALNGGQDDA